MIIFISNSSYTHQYGLIQTTIAQNQADVVFSEKTLRRVDTNNPLSARSLAKRISTTLA